MADQIMTVSGLMQLLQEVAGASAESDSGGDVLDTAFTDLGYDSIAILEAAGRLEIDYGIKLPDAVVSEAHTPRLLIHVVNNAISHSD